MHLPMHGVWAARSSPCPLGCLGFLHQPPSALQGDFPLKAERVIQSVMAICNALAAVESQEITVALNQMPPCPSRMQPKIQKVSDGRGRAGPWGVRDQGAQPGGAEGKHIFTSDFFPSFLPLYHVENSSIAGSRQLPGRAACSGSRGARAGYVKRLAWRAAPCRQRGADSDGALVVSFSFFPQQDPNVLAKRENRGISVLFLPFWAQVLGAFNPQTPPPQLLRPKMCLKPFWLRKEGFWRQWLLFLPVNSAKWEA